ESKRWSLYQAELHVVHNAVIGLVDGEAQSDLAGVRLWIQFSTAIIKLKKLNGWTSGKPKWGD
ncbi:hypothetical protein CRENBAI_017531, partial [Crenichthys baileyi]